MADHLTKVMTVCYSKPDAADSDCVWRGAQLPVWRNFRSDGI